VERGQPNSFMFLGSRLLTQYVPDGAHFSHVNALGSETQTTDWSGGNPAAIVYYPWGRVWNNPSQLYPNTLLQEFASLTMYDTATNGYVPPFRYYVSNQGRWLTPDPLAGDVTNPQSLNRYAYVMNNPTSFTDPSGLGSGCTWDELNCNPADYCAGQGWVTSPECPGPGSGGGEIWFPGPLAGC
jgi:RHS repeat-associated protein